MDVVLETLARRQRQHHGVVKYSRKVMALSRLEGQALTEAKVDLDRGRARLTFDLGGVLELRPMTVGTDDELWSLYRPRNYVLSVFGDSTYSHGRQSHGRSQQVSKSNDKYINGQ